MKKIPLFLKILVPIFIAFAVAGAFFAVKLAGTAKMLSEKNAQAEEAEAVPTDIYKSDYKTKKVFPEFDENDYVNLFFKYFEDDALAKFEFGNIKFISYSESWDENDLEDLSHELFANEHGDEIYEIDYVILHEGPPYLFPAVVSPNTDSLSVPIVLNEIFPYEYTFYLSQDKNVLKLYYSNYYDTVEVMAPQLSYAYGMYYMNYYFDLFGDDIVEDEPYFKLRYESDYDIFYKEEDFEDKEEDYDQYHDNQKWYLLDIAANDYVYLMGSENTRKTFEFIDTYDQLVLDARNKEDELDEYNEQSAYDYFNKGPHLNIVLPLPDSIEGLPELLYGAIDKNPPEYQDHSEAEEIEITVKRRTKYGEPYYTVTWNKPWKDEGVKYTLVGYDENDNIETAIKTIDADESTKSIIGGAVYDTSADRFTYYEDDRWTRAGFVRLRVIVTFSDGTAAVSPAVDWSFE